MRNVLRRFIRLLRLVQATAVLRSRYWAREFLKNSVPLNDVHVDRARDQVVLHRLGLRLGKNKAFFLKRYWDMVLLSQRMDARFSTTEDSGILVEIQGLKFKLQAPGQVYNLREIFWDGVYDLSMKSCVVIWDVGTNVGISALYFAAKECVISVIGFEPFGQTFLQAKENLALNPRLAENVKIWNTGVGGSNRRSIVSYDVSISDQQGIFNRTSVSMNSEEIELRDASEILAQIAEEHPNVPIVAKIDCEGAEYEIISSLVRAGEIKHLTAVIMEWHIKLPSHTPDDLVRLLTEAGFVVLCRDAYSDVGGMLYAVRFVSRWERNG